MNTERSYLTLPLVYYDEFEPYSDEQVGKMLRALFRYAIFGEKIVFEGEERFFAKRLMNQERLSREKYAEMIRQRSIAGRKGAEARKAKAEAALLSAEALPLVSDGPKEPCSEKTMPWESNSFSETVKLDSGNLAEAEAASSEEISLSEADLRERAIGRMRESGFGDEDLYDFIRSCRDRSKGGANGKDKPHPGM